MNSRIFGKADLHIHSKYSHDAFSPIKKILKKADERGLNLVAITDHNVISGAKEAEKISEDFKVKVIVGEEVDTDEGDVLALFIKELIPPHLPLKEALKEIHKQGGLAIIPHPSNWLLGGLPIKAISENYKDVDGLELFNASIAGAINRKKITKFNKKIFHLTATASSDAHLAGAVGRTYTIFPGRTAEDLYQAIKNKETSLNYCSWTIFDHILWIINFPRRFFKNPMATFKDLKELINNIIKLNKYRIANNNLNNKNVKHNHPSPK